jgi:hypothetical protein
VLGGFLSAVFEGEERWVAFAGCCSSCYNCYFSILDPSFFYFFGFLSHIILILLHLCVYLISSYPLKNLLHKDGPLGQSFGFSRFGLDVVGIHVNLNFGAFGTWPSLNWINPFTVLVFFLFPHFLF